MILPFPEGTQYTEDIIYKIGSFTNMYVDVL